MSPSRTYRSTLAVGTLALLLGGASLDAASRRQLPSFSGANGWLNSTPLTAAALRGNVVLVQF